jgi:hypothetical protein
VGEKGEGLSCDRSLFISSVAQGDRGVIGMMGQPGFPGLPGHMGLPVRFFFFFEKFDIGNSKFHFCSSRVHRLDFVSNFENCQKIGTRNIHNFDFFFIGIVKNDNLSRVSTVQAVLRRRNRFVTIDSRNSNFSKLSKMN